MERAHTIKKFNSKTRELFYVIEQNPNWKEYVTDQTAEIVNTLLVTKNITKTMHVHDMKYTTIHAHLILALNRIKEHRTDFSRKGQSKQSQELFYLMDMVPDWESYVTEHEAKLAETYRELKNFYDVGRKLNVKPNNIVAALYGSTQKIGVVGKLKRVFNDAKQSS